MKKGIYTGNAITYHQQFGVLVPSGEIELPDDWDWEKETLFVPASDVVVNEPSKQATSKRGDK
jgi:hypothetical protein